jgi:hypothetical protein
MSVETAIPTTPYYGMIDGAEQNRVGYCMLPESGRAEQQEGPVFSHEGYMKK